MSFVKKIWKDRISQFPNRRTINDGYVTKQVTVGRDEGAVTEEGTPFDATEMNDLENRIYAAIEEGGGGGGGAGTFDYTELFNKPRINNHELDGNKTTADLGISYDDLADKPTASNIEYSSGVSVKDKIDTKQDSDVLNIQEAFTTGTTTTQAIQSLINDYGTKTMVYGIVIQALGWFTGMMTFYQNTQGGGYLLQMSTGRFWSVTYVNGTITLTEKT